MIRSCDDGTARQRAGKAGKTGKALANDTQGGGFNPRKRPFCNENAATGTLRV